MLILHWIALPMLTVPEAGERNSIQRSKSHWILFENLLIIPDTHFKLNKVSAYYSYIFPHAFYFN